MKWIINTVLPCLTIKGPLSQFFTVLYVLLLHHKVKFPECAETVTSDILKEKIKKNTHKCHEPDPMHCFQMQTLYFLWLCLPHSGQNHKQNVNIKPLTYDVSSEDQSLSMIVQFDYGLLKI